MSIIPGVSTQQRLEIQSKLDKIIQQNFLNICPHFVEKNNNFNLQLSKYILSSENCKFNSNLAKNFHFKIYDSHKFEHMKEFENNLYKPKTLLNKLFQNFSISELMILLNNLNVFVKNEKIRQYFPIIKGESIEDIFENKTTDENSQKKFLPLLIPYTKKKDVKIKLKKHLIKEVNNLIINEKQKKIEEQIDDKKRKKLLNDILNDSNRKLLNIPSIVEKERINHPLIEYYINERRMKQSHSTSILYHKPNIKKYQELHDINVKQINFLNTLKSNLLIQNNLNNKFKILRNKSNNYI